MKPLKRPVYLRDDLIAGHDVWQRINPLVCQPLVDVLKAQKFKYDPTLSTLAEIFPRFDAFGYRLQSRMVFGEYNKCLWMEAYHEGFHTLISLRFGKKTRGRPLITLLNECLAQPLDLYFVLKLEQCADVKVQDMVPLGSYFILNAKKMGFDFHKRWKKDRNTDPFKIYKECALEVYALHKECFLTFKESRGDMNKLVQRMSKIAKRQKYFNYHGHVDHANGLLFLANYCGFESTSEDIKLEKELMEIFKSSRSFEEFLVELDIGKFMFETPKKKAA